MPRVILFKHSNNKKNETREKAYSSPESLVFKLDISEVVNLWKTHAFSNIGSDHIESFNALAFEEYIKKTPFTVGSTNCTYLVDENVLIRQELIDKIEESAANIVAVDLQLPEFGDDVNSVSLISAERQIVVIRLDQFALLALQRIWLEQQIHNNYDLTQVYSLLHRAGMTIDIVSGQPGCAIVDEQFKLAHFILGTKAETLHRLQGMLHHASIPRLTFFTVNDWENDRGECVKAIQAIFPSTQVVVRSSSHAEDGWLSSQAGAFDSVLNVNAKNPSEISSAVDKVVSSYASFQPTSQVLVQEMVLDVDMSGVIFTRSLGKMAPYYVINFDDKSGRTDSVTSGNSSDLRTVIIYRNTPNLKENLDPRLWCLIEAAREIEGLLNYDALDIEFAIEKQTSRVLILQVRPLATESRDNTLLDDSVLRYLSEAKQRLRIYQEKTPHISGNKTILGVMPDANPAELIGTKAKPLAASLYRFLITDEVVAEERAKYGYVDIRPSPLMISVAGHPYVDVRASFNSFTPAELDKGITQKLIDSYIGHLQSSPSFHDKVEFEIVFTCWFADLAKQVETRYPGVFSNSEINKIESAFATLTLKAIESIEDDIALVEKQKAQHVEIMSSNINPLHSAVLLMRNARLAGTGIFVRLARSGFVAVTLLKSFVRCGFITQSEMDGFIASLNGVTSQIEELAVAVQNEDALFEDLVKRCGHLRPGTYDISMSAYFEDVESFIQPMVKNAVPRQKPTFDFRDDSRVLISNSLKSVGINISFDFLVKFCRLAIEGREYSKFVYTQSLSHSLNYLQEWGTDFGLSRDDLSYLEWNDFVNILYGNICADVEGMSELVAKSQRLYAMRESLELPILITKEMDLYSFEKSLLEPNYITQNKVLAEILVVNGKDNSLPNLSGKIVMIPSADPGYDWLFAQQIGGLITMYGGANSHMAIRSAELRLPAAIGVGEKIYSKLTQANTVSLNCEIRSINVIS